MVSDSHIFDILVEGRTVIVTPKTCLTEFDFAQIELEGKKVSTWLEQQDLSNVLLDLKNSDYFGSSAVGFFMKLWKWARTKKGKMAVVNYSPHALELIRLIQADKLWHLADARESALQWLAEQA
jgi:anti-anti-sigma factor